MGTRARGRNSPGPPCSECSSPTPGSRGEAEQKADNISARILARSASPSARATAAADTNWLSRCRAAEVTRSREASAFPGPLRSRRGAPAGAGGATVLAPQIKSIAIWSCRACVTHCKERGGKTATSLNQISLVGAPPQSRLAGTSQGNPKRYELRSLPPYPCSAREHDN